MHFRHVCCSVRACTDLFSWMTGRGAGARPLPFDHLWGRIRGATPTLHNHSQSTAAKNGPIKVLRPSTHHRGRSSNARRAGLPHRYPEQLATSFLAPENCKKYGYWFSTGPKLTFCTKLFKIRPPSATIGKCKISFFFPFWRVFFLPFFFLPFAFSGPFLP